eukprot:360763-Chlamydomonas_euryale.AAC.1
MPASKGGRSPPSAWRASGPPPRRCESSAEASLMLQSATRAWAPSLPSDGPTASATSPAPDVMTASSAKRQPVLHVCAIAGAEVAAVLPPPAHWPPLPPSSSSSESCSEICASSSSCAAAVDTYRAQHLLRSQTKHITQYKNAHHTVLKRTSHSIKTHITQY